ncbi:MAG: hypothetical protein NTZ78_02845 [Candidatus Aureabacteria bacterium]|nr:hypothetical protein [Candidatus Auribacterota bacterium]
MRKKACSALGSILLAGAILIPGILFAVEETAVEEPEAVEPAAAEPATVEPAAMQPAAVEPATMDTGAKGSAEGPKKSYSAEVGNKLSRAATNLVRSGTEFYVQPMEAKRESGNSISMIWPGLGEGLGMFLTRVFGGAIEGVTCMVPFPNGWKPLLDE